MIKLSYVTISPFLDGISDVDIRATGINRMGKPRIELHVDLPRLDLMRISVLIDHLESLSFELADHSYGL